MAEVPNMGVFIPLHLPAQMGKRVQDIYSLLVSNNTSSDS